MAGELITTVDGPRNRLYYCCGRCRLIFVDPSYFPSAEAEERRYRTHNNSIDSPGYVSFLMQAVETARPYMRQGMRGLDYGCGPVPTLSILLEQHGVPCENYDPFFFPDFPDKTFDIIFATECVEHFFHPARELTRIRNLLAADGMLVIMTEKWISFESFRDWYYARDFTHVAFYHADTMAYIGRRFGFERLASDNPKVTALRNIGGD